MVAVIIAIAVSGILGVGHIKGWFDKSDENTAVLTDFRGITTLQRDGVAYATTDETVLRKGDKITCDPGATVRITLGENYIALGQNADAEIINPDADEFALKVNVGEAFVNTNGSVSLEFADKQTEISNTVATLSVRKGAQSISVYQGSVGEATEGQMLEWIGDKESVRNFSVKSLNDFNISQIRKANETKTLVFSNDDLDKLENERWEQMHGSTETTTETTVTETVTSTHTEKTTKKETTSLTTEKKEPTATVPETTVKPTTTKTQTTTEKTTKNDCRHSPSCDGWSGWVDSNHRQTAYKAVPLTDCGTSRGCLSVQAVNRLSDLPTRKELMMMQSIWQRDCESNTDKSGQSRLHYPLCYPSTLTALHRQRPHHSFIFRRSSFDGRNATVSYSPTEIGSPVAGLYPFLSPLSRLRNVPNPLILISSPCWRQSSIASKIVFTISSAS